VYQGGDTVSVISPLCIPCSVFRVPGSGFEEFERFEEFEELVKFVKFVKFEGFERIKEFEELLLLF